MGKIAIFRYTQTVSDRLHIETRPADSSLADTIWRSESRAAGPFLSIATNRVELVVSRHEGRLYCTVRGPETHATVAHCPPEGEWVGIQFKLGVFLPHLPTSDLVDGDIELPSACRRSFWLHGSAWEFPTFENAEVFVERLLRAEVLVREPVVEAAIQNEPTDVTQRTLERRFLRATGLTRSAAEQITRARHATNLLQQGTSIGDTVALAGYYDQPHLTKSLRRLIGRTPAQLLANNSPLPLSLLADTE